MNLTQWFANIVFKAGESPTEDAVQTSDSPTEDAFQASDSPTNNIEGNTILVQESLWNLM